MSNKETYTMKLDVLTPTHIGCDEKLQKVDLFVGNDKIAILDGHQWTRLLRQYNLLETYLEEASRAGKELNNWAWLQEKNRALDLWSMKEPPFQALMPKPGDMREANDIARFVHDVHQKPYIPGSSLKGVFRSAVLAATIQKEENAAHKERIWNEIDADIGNPYARKATGDKVQEKLLQVFRTPQNGNGKDYDRMLADPFRGLSVSDTAAFGNDATMLSRKLDLTLPVGRNGIEKALPIWRECIRPEQSTTFQLTLDYGWFRHVRLDIHSLQDFLSMLDVYRSIQVEYFESIALREVKKSRSNYQAAQKPQDAKTVLLGGGIGFHTKSLLYAIAPDPDSARILVSKLLAKQTPPNHKHGPDKDAVVSPRTLKCAKVEGFTSKFTKVEGLYRMGMCAISEVK